MDKTKKELHTFFEETIEGAVARHQLGVSNLARNYLIGMLDRFALTEELFPLGQPDTITFQYFKVLQETYKLRQQQLNQQLGDHCLFLVGYFYDFIRKQGEGQVQYYSDIGSGAYGELGTYPFAELAHKFDDLYVIIGNLHLPELNKDENVVKMYQKWQETQDRYYESLLLAKGIVPQKVN
jgi:hypothetical protein